MPRALALIAAVLLAAACRAQDADGASTARPVSTPASDVAALALPHLRPVTYSGVARVEDLVPAGDAIPRRPDRASVMLARDWAGGRGARWTWIEIDGTSASITSVVLRNSEEPVITRRRLGDEESASTWDAFAAVGSVERHPSIRPRADADGFAQLGAPAPRDFLSVRWSRDGEAGAYVAGALGRCSGQDSLRAWEQVVGEASWNLFASLDSGDRPASLEDARCLLRFLSEESERLTPATIGEAAPLLRMAIHSIASLGLDDRAGDVERLRDRLVAVGGADADDLLRTIEWELGIHGAPTRK